MAAVEAGKDQPPLEAVLKWEVGRVPKGFVKYLTHHVEEHPPIFFGKPFSYLHPRTLHSAGLLFHCIHTAVKHMWSR